MERAGQLSPPRGSGPGRQQPLVQGACLEVGVAGEGLLVGRPMGSPPPGDPRAVLVARGETLGQKTF